MFTLFTKSPKTPVVIGFVGVNKLVYNLFTLPRSVVFEQKSFVRKS